jgi:DNA-binding NarL/FixJ family response regulator
MMLALSAMVTVLAVVALAVSVYALLQSQKMAHAARQTNKALREECAAAIEQAHSQFKAIASEAQTHTQTEKLPMPAEVLPGVPKSSMNVTRRSQALRLHRKGDSTEQIAAALEVPRQEVDLLIKIHQIVLNNL